MNSLRLFLAKFPGKPTTRFTAFLLVLSLVAVTLVSGITAREGDATTVRLEPANKVQCGAIAIAQPNLPNGVPGSSYSQTLSASGGSAPYSWTISDGALPDGMELNVKTGELQGVPSAGVYNFTVRASSNGGNGCFAERSYALLVDNCPSISILPSTLLGLEVGVPVSRSLSASGGRPPHAFSVISGALPPGVLLAPYGFLYGTPATAGTYTFTVKAVDVEGCAGTQSYTVNVAGGACTYAISPAGANIAAGGGTGAVSVTASSSSCGWTATSNAAWLTIISGVTGAGNGTVNYSVAANTGAARTGTLSIAGQTFTVSQSAGPTSCDFAINPTGGNFAAFGGTGVVGLTASSASCGWTATSNAVWLTVTSGASGAGNGAIGYSVATNTGPARTGTISIAGQTFTVGQAAGTSGCTYSLSASSYLSPAAGGSSSVNVITQDNCSWTVVNNTPWIVMISGPTGQGSRAVNFFVQPNSGAPRSGAITIAGITFTVEQVGTLPCSFGISPSSQSFGVVGGTGSVSVTTAIGCGWGVSIGAPWITINSGAFGAGNGTVTFTVAANTGALRIATMLIAGQTFTVAQDGSAGCPVTITPTSQNFASGAGAGTVAVAAASSCVWAAVSNAPWVTVTSGAVGAGNGAVTFSIAENSGAARTGTISIGGQLFTITQDGTSSGCVTEIKPDSRSFSGSGGLGVIAVTAPEGCTWGVITNRDWIKITNGRTGHGNDNVRFTVAPNTTGSRRTGTIFIDGQEVLISQSR